MSTKKNGLMSVLFGLVAFFCGCQTFARPEKAFFLMINPAGDAQHAGRKLDDSFERGVTLQFAQEFKKELEAKYPEMRVVLTWGAGEIVQPFQNATFANRLAVDFYISLHCFQETSTLPTMYIYSLSLGDEYVIKPSPFAFYRYDQAHLLHRALTCHWAQHLQSFFTETEYRRIVACKGPFSIPFAPLMGIVAPAIALDCGIKNKNDWHLYIEPLVASLEKMYSSYAG